MSYSLQNNTPTAGCIKWIDLKMQYNGITYEIQDGYTNAVYVYWKLQYPTTLVASNTYPTLTNDDCMVFLNKSGIGATVPSATILDGSLIVPETIMANAIASNAITTDKLAVGAVTANTVAANAIGASAIAAGAINADKIEAGAINTDKIAVGAIVAENIVAETITGAEIAAETITGNNIVANSIDTAQIAAGAITASEIEAGAITTAHISAGAVTAENLATGALTVGKFDLEDEDTNNFFNNQNAALGEYKKEVSNYLDFTNAEGLVIGQNNGQFKTVIDATKMSFRDGNTEVASISNEKLDIKNGEIDILRIGNFLLKSEDGYFNIDYNGVV